MGFWEKLFGEEPTPEEIAEFLREQGNKRRAAQRERAIKKALRTEQRKNDGAIGELTEEALRQFKDND